jgi:hypothetical protein
MKTLAILLIIALSAISFGCVTKKKATEDDTHLMHGGGRVQTTPMSDSVMPGR